jgi:metal-responsive CopG/Arc/MetJ family transcriptional regulator
VNMAKDPPDRISISLPPDADIDPDLIDELVADSEANNRSELIRQLVKEAAREE